MRWLIDFAFISVIHHAVILLSLKEGFCPLTPQKVLHIVYLVRIDTIGGKATAPSCGARDTLGGFRPAAAVVTR
jgi:hypothetical protein